MINVYINYPNSRITIHKLKTCSYVTRQKKDNQRKIIVNLDNLSDELTKFKNRKRTFRPTKEYNDLWVLIDLGDKRYEIETLKYIQLLLSKQYKPFSDITLKTHCK